MKWIVALSIVLAGLPAAAQSNPAWEVLLTSGLRARDQGRFAEAETTLFKALEALGGSNAPHDRRWGMVQQSLAIVYRSQGKMSRAAALYEELARLWDKDGDAGNRLLAHVYVDLAETRVYEQRYPEAEQLLMKALAIFRGAGGEEDPGVGVALSGLGHLYGEEGRLGEAEQTLTKAIAIQRASRPPESPDLVASLELLGEVYLFLGRYQLAEQMLQEALAGTSGWGETNPGVADVLTSLAVLFREKREYARAEPLLRKAVRIYETPGNPEGPRLAKALLEQGHLARMDRKYTLAGQRFRRAFDILRSQLGPEHLMVAAAENSMAMLACDQRDFPAAHDLLAHAVSAAEAASPAPHPLLAVFLHNLAQVEEREHLFDEAEAHYRRAVEIVEATLGPNHPRLADLLRSHARLVRRTDRAEARRIETRAKSLLKPRE